MSQRRKSIWTGAIIGALLAFIFTAGVQARADEVREEFHQTYSLAADGRVSLANINGNVSITSWDRNEVKVDAVKRAGSKQRLDEAKIVVDAQPNAIAIKTQYPYQNGSWGRNDNPASVDYTLTVPRNARLDAIKLINGNLSIESATGEVHAESINGTVSAKGLTGHADLSTINGHLEASFQRLASGDIRLHSVNGSVSLTIPSDAQADVSAKTMNGHISNDFGLPVQDHRYVGHDLRGTLGNGGTRVALENVNGSISIRHASDGKPLSKATSKLSPAHERDDDSRL